MLFEGSHRLVLPVNLDQGDVLLASTTKPTRMDVIAKIAFMIRFFTPRLPFSQDCNTIKIHLATMRATNSGWIGWFAAFSTSLVPMDMHRLPSSSIIQVTAKVPFVLRVKGVFRPFISQTPREEDMSPDVTWLLKREKTKKSETLQVPVGS